MNNFIICGMQFGDEGKGSFVDYLTRKHNAEWIIRYNGGSHASHTVTLPDGGLHKFSQLGSGMFLPNTKIYITRNMVVNLENLFTEMRVFSEKTGESISDLCKRIVIDECCYLVTPYHRLINRLRELAKGSKRRGSVGTGVSEVMYLLKKEKIGIKVEDLANCVTSGILVDNREEYCEHFTWQMKKLYNYASRLYQQHHDDIFKNVPTALEENLKKEISYLLGYDDAYLRVARSFIDCFEEVCQNYGFHKCIRPGLIDNVWKEYAGDLTRNDASVIFEGSQGLLIDHKYGIRPNTTYLDTTIGFANRLVERFGASGWDEYLMNHHKISSVNTHKIGIAKAFSSRHGKGIFPTEDAVLSEKISDKNQVATYWNGEIRFGWFDAVLLRYAQSINHVHELYLSALDQLDEFDTIKVCNSYQYTGEVDEHFRNMFYYYTLANGEVIVTDIKHYGKALGRYLKDCHPIYITTKGWKKKTGDTYLYLSIPKECKEYISLISNLTKIPVKVASFGPTWINKVPIV